MLVPFLQQLRVHQWVKNLLLFAPLALAHHLTDSGAVQTLLVAVCAFSFVASSIYVVNDLADLAADREHPTKRHRPLAAGVVKAGHAVGVVVVLMIAACMMSLTWLPTTFTILLGVYVALTTAYSFALKRVMLLDVLLLSSLYTLRILAGGAAVDVVVSPWLLMFSMFLFTSLAFVKRYTELLDVQERSLQTARGRGYMVSDLQMIRTIGPAVGIVAVLVFVQYINSHDVTRLYTHPTRLWLAVPVLMFWIARIWFLANRRQVHDDPIVFAVRDVPSYLVVAILGGIALAAR